ncbi:MAG: lytic transglycosylase domain-containing protein [Pseudomonadota bacterium]
MRGVLLALALGGQALAAPDPAALCDQAAAAASARHGVPLDVMRAITRTETGRSRGGVFSPWPWTVNMEGAGYWFDSQADALAFAKTHHARGARSFDVGCFQINYRWHGEAFEGVPAMFDPAQNADYAARFLSDLYAETGAWEKAAGHYHSRTPDLAKRYRARFAEIRADLGPVAAEPPLPPTTPARPLPAVELGIPAHEVPAGGVRLAMFAEGRGLLRPAKPLISP